ncbi:hypothetical protein [Bacillus wiedmannii]|nr:hypothetical protein [Bacillus wiedmannii]
MQQKIKTCPLFIASKIVLLIVNVMIEQSEMDKRLYFNKLNKIVI